MTSLQEFIKGLSRDRRVSQIGIANAIGYSKNSFSNIIRGEQSIPPDFARLISRFFFLTNKEKNQLKAALVKMPKVSAAIPPKYTTRQVLQLDSVALQTLCLNQAHYITLLEAKVENLQLKDFRAGNPRRIKGDMQ